MRIVINGQEIDPTDGQALADAGVYIGGSIVAGNSYGVTGGTVTGDVYVGQTNTDDE